MHDVTIFSQDRCNDNALCLHYGSIATPFGPALIANIGDRLCTLSFEPDPIQALKSLKKRFPLPTCEHPKKAEVGWSQVLEHLGSGKSSLKLLLRGTAFQCAVWQALLGIERGQTLSYQTIAESIHHPKAVRAVGQAVGANPLAIIVPCHRVIQKNGKLGGFAYGIAFKKRLLALERDPKAALSLKTAPSEFLGNG